MLDSNQQHSRNKSLFICTTKFTNTEQLVLITVYIQFIYSQWNFSNVTPHYLFYGRLLEVVFESTIQLMLPSVLISSPIPRNFELFLNLKLLEHHEFHQLANPSLVRQRSHAIHNVNWNNFTVKDIETISYMILYQRIVGILTYISLNINLFRMVTYH